MLPHWFGQHEVSPGVIIELEQSRWRVLPRKEHGFPNREDDDPQWSGSSYACIQLRVRQVGSRIRPPVQGYMRIYKQIPTEGTIADPQHVRARQARNFIPHELQAFRMLMRKGSTFTPRLLDSLEGKQDDHSLVPGGFIAWVVSEVVSGIRLGDARGEDTFWSMELSVREKIRASFKENYMKLARWGWIPLYLFGKDLVWDSETSTLFFMNWFQPTKIESPHMWEDRFFYSSGLLKPPASPRFTFQHWNGSVEGWQG
ncbi:hypothetical protein AbraIFM66950_004005 [Aspergillus brasiliensis]|nr:hypothetical protein AbraIFM66950_004005 [Aspergillus brasiliensis]